MYGEDAPAPRYDRPAAPVGVRIVVVILLLCGLALAALPLTVLLTGGSEPGRLTLENASGETLRGVRVVRVVGAQERLVGAAHDLADGATTPVEFDPEGRLRLRIEFDTGRGHHTVPLELGQPGDADTRVRIGEDLAVRVLHAIAPAAAEPESSAVPPPEPAAPPAPPADETARASAGPFPLPEGWSEKWRPWFENVDWAVGPDAGSARARETGKPMLLFYTATW